jgi:HEAT repeat protein
MSDRQSETEVPLQQVLTELLEGDFQTRWQAAKLIPNIGEVAIAPLVKLLESEDADVELCWFIARILGEFEQKSAIAALVNLLRTTENEEVKTMAAITLANFEVKAIAPLTDLLAEPRWRLLAVQSLAQISHPDTIEPLLSTLNDSQPNIRAVTLAALSNYHDSRILPVLMQSLEDPAAEVRLHATIGIGLRCKFQEELELVKLLQVRLQDEDIRVSQQAAISLSRCGSEAAINSLFQTLQSPNTPVAFQISLVRALSWIETPISLKYLKEATEFISVSACQEVVLVLGRVEQPELKIIAAKILRELLYSENPVFQKVETKAAIALGFGQLKAIQEIECLKELLEDLDPKVRLHAIAAFKKLSG